MTHDQTVSLTLPLPRTPEPADAPALRWGVLGAGGIAASFVDALATTQQVVAAVGSRDVAKAQAFIDAHLAGRGTETRAHGSYEDLVADPDVDVVYVATPHSEHRDHALLAIDAGKHVLVEKAFARNATEAREIVAAARERGVFAMEAMWSRFLPHYDVVRQSLELGLLGDVETVIADHGQLLYPDGPQRMSDPALAGGALLDLGIYPVSFAAFVLGDISSVHAVGTLTDAGVDAQCSIVLTSPTRTHASLSTTMTARTPTTASINGTAARLEIDGDFYMPNVVRLLGTDNTVLDEVALDPTERHRGLRFEAAEVARCVTAGLTESPLLPLDETVRIMEILDEVRDAVGVVYPGE
ncbi:Gfo/Idh/MocA family protein [Janibacter sp. G56]|uniref:Gfo/Idh/MocA family protein n=1 Tax=Janibacter sp. G56 TaxID=3418717 RepID=UPI003D06DC42